ncbi:MAG: branched-chain-amino-acid transaminase [Deltaproteobacteria bacterium]|nr:branched-chain-amino-acid transaminase [Deltaproteobacteria bacterium]
MDGRLVAWDDAKVHVLTHTLHYGFGVFEGIRCYQTGAGRSAIFRLAEHNRRLFDSAKILGLKIPFSVEEIEKACVETVRVNKLKECYIRPIAFVGEGEMGVPSALTNPVRVAIITWPWGAYLGDDGLKNGIRVMTSSFARFHVNTLMTKAKAVGHYVNSVLAVSEARAAGFDEALMLDTDGFVSEASGENVFVVRRGAVKTTPLTSILEGITRASVMQLLRESGVAVAEDRFTRDEIYIAEEAFFTGTAAEVTPIRELDRRPVGSGRPGEITRLVQDRFFAILKGEDKRHEDWLTYL